MLKLKNLLNISNKSFLNRTLRLNSVFHLNKSLITQKSILTKRSQIKHFSTTTASLNKNTFNNNNNNNILNNNDNNSISNNKNQIQNNFSSTIYENASHYIKYKERYLTRMENQKFLTNLETSDLRNSTNFANMLFIFKYYTERRTDLLRFIREFYNLYNIIDDKFLVLLLKKIFADMQNLEFEELDKVCLIVLKKGIRDFEVLSYFKKFIILLPHNFTYANIGNLMLQVDQMNLLTNDSHLRKFYSEFVLSGLIKLNYNDLIFAFDGLSKIKSVDAYVWNIGQYLILKKFNKLYRINSLRRLVSSLCSVGLNETSFWKIVDQYVYYNFEKIPQVAVILELVCFVNKNLGYNSLGERVFMKFFNLVVSRKTFKDFKILVNAFGYIKDNSDIEVKSINNITNNNNKNLDVEKNENFDFSSKNENDGKNKELLANSSNKTAYVILPNKNPSLDKIKAHLKVCLETQLDQIDIETISVLFEQDKNYLKDFNSTLLNDKYFALFIEKIDSFSKDWQFKFYFEMGKYDSRFKQYANKLKIGNDSVKINSLVNEFNFLMMIKNIKDYENTQEPNAKFFLANLIQNFNDVLNKDLEAKYFELLIALIPYCPSILKYLNPELKKKKLNQVINGFMEYKNQVFIGNQAFTKKTKEENENKNKIKIIGENSEIDFDKFIVLKILNNLNPKKLNLQGDLLEIIQNAELVKIDIAKSYLIQVISLIYNMSLEDLEKIYNLKFCDSVYDKYVN